MRIIQILLFSSYLFSQQSFSVTPLELDSSRNNALAWLFQNQNGEGSWGDHLGLRVQSTSEALQALARYGMAESYASKAGQSWLSNQEVNSTDSLSAVVKGLAVTEGNNTAQKNRLLANRGGATNNYNWGAYSGYQYSVIDTSVALDALKVASYNDSFIGGSLFGIAIKQLDNGSWAMNQSQSQGSIIATAQVLITFSPYTADFYINKALNWLRSQQKTDGGFAEDASSTYSQVYETAQVVKAILQTQEMEHATALNTTYQTVLKDAQDFLINQQLSSGEWQSGVLATLAALQISPTTSLDDYDEDGVPDEVEIILGTNIAMPDSRQFSMGNGESIEGLTTSSSLMNIISNQSVNTTLQPEGGTEPYHWKIISGSLPDGVTLDASTGLLNGTAEQLGYFNFIYKVVDTNGWTEEKLVQIKIGGNSDIPVLDIAIDTDVNPVSPGVALVYTITYSNHGSEITTNSSLKFPLPQGVSFVSASAGGTLNGKTVEWDLNSIPAHSGAEQQVIVHVDNSLADGSILEVDNATISGTVNSLQKSSFTSLVTSINSHASQMLAIELDSEPILASEKLVVNLMIKNLSYLEKENVTISLRYPEFLKTLPNEYISDNGNCSGTGCDADEFVTWELESLAANSTKKLILPSVINNNLQQGRLITFTATGNDDSNIQITSSNTVFLGKNFNMVDSDEDTVPDRYDNCTLVFNTLQIDTDSDGYGNACDADLNDDGFVSGRDFRLFKKVYLTDNAEADFNGDGFVDKEDEDILRKMWGDNVGPSSYHKPSDTDGDSVIDKEDNCIFVFNTSQTDTDNDDYGNACDPDLNNDGFVSGRDFRLFKKVYLTENAEADFNGDGFVDKQDEDILRKMWGDDVGPSAYNPTSGDSDGDTIPDGYDNCILAFNILQTDTDSDRYGNACDGDLNNDGIVNRLDNNLVRRALLTDDEYADFNGDGFVDRRDKNIFRKMWNSDAGFGPSAYH